jgi:hypothetical protein
VAALISSGPTKVSADVTGERKPSGARKVVRVLLNSIGIGAAAGGTYFTVLVVSAILDIIRLVRSNPQKGIAEAAAGTSHAAMALLGGLNLLFIFVFGSIAVICFLIAVWLLDPFQRWRDWRSGSANDVIH